MKIATIIGARPQFVKVAAVSRAINTHNQQHGPQRLDDIIIHTGQHYDETMSAVFFRDLEIPSPAYNLDIGSGSHGRQTAQMLMAIEEVLIQEKPDWVIVYGDTNSTLAGALAAVKLNIRIAHVEAGLRSFNRLMPEEINRVMTDHVAHLLLCPSQTAVQNLAAEGIMQGVQITGDVMADALQFAASKASVKSSILETLCLQEKGYLLATVHRAENTDNIERLNNILSAFKALEETIVFPVHPRTRKLLKATGYHPPRHVKIIDPVGYFDFVALEQSARIILTDSGGIQKEAYWLHVPCITLRDETEWVETVASGWNVLTGARQNRIIDAVRSFKCPHEHLPLYGDGKAAMHCIQAIIEAV